ncbi:MAG TPA: OmpA family protein [Thermoanaerobaculia bacterium]|jgi:peptidoglycan-associated lipoprotein|nr:OmpA family protein [Thermoanaerobaculia bacterium]
MKGLRVGGACLGVAAALAILPGCATKKYVSGEVEKSSAKSEKHISDVESQVEQTQTKVNEHEQRLTRLDKSTQDALARASEAGKLAQGKFNYAVVLSDDTAHFPVNGHELSDEARQQLDEFVEKMKNDDKNVYLEIQGHTDSTGSPEYNMRLGQERADAVRLYLNQKGVALNRMSTISYGETQPVESNKTKTGRSKNRRVVIVVLS